MNSLEDYQVDRPEVYRRISKGLELTGTNRVNDLFILRVCFAIIELPMGLAEAYPISIAHYISFFPR